MFVVDASSDQLNNGNEAGTEGTTDWDMMRRVLADPVSSVYDASADVTGIVASQVTHVGMIALGESDPEPANARLLLQYGPCTRPRVEWALDPRTSCAAGGCTDPWAGPPITWTFVDGSTVDPPNFFLPTFSHMPRCEQGNGQACSGSGRTIDAGIELSRTNRISYLAQTPFTTDPNSAFVNILLVSGPYAGSSTDAAVQAALEGAFGDGIVTYVVGFGRGLTGPDPMFSEELANMAAWGSATTKAHYEAPTEADLVQSLAAIVADLEVPCCRTIDCSPIGGADSGGGSDTEASTWGSADGDGSASASDTAGTVGSDTMTMGSSGGSIDQDTGKIDDDGGCTCRGAPQGMPRHWAFVLLVAFAIRRSTEPLRSRRRASRRREPDGSSGRAWRTS
jgi:hypothetical protein